MRFVEIYRVVADMELQDKLGIETEPKYEKVRCMLDFDEIDFFNKTTIAGQEGVEVTLKSGNGLIVATTFEKFKGLFV